jgi:uncharacterized protein (DUF2147 family)
LLAVKVRCRNTVAIARHNDFHKTGLNRKEIHMRTRSLAISAIIIAALVLAFSAISIAADDPFVGIWKQDSTTIMDRATNRGILLSQTLTITAQGNGYKMVLYIEFVDAKPTSSENAMDIDGKERPVTGETMYDAIMGLRVDANTFDVVTKKAGKELGSMRYAVSEDGKTLTRTLRGKNAKGEVVSSPPNVFIKQ